MTYQKPLEEAQIKALKLMEARNASALFTRLGWTWRSDVRHSVDAALAILEILDRAHVKEGQ